MGWIDLVAAVFWPDGISHCISRVMTLDPDHPCSHPQISKLLFSIAFYLLSRATELPDTSFQIEAKVDKKTPQM